MHRYNKWVATNDLEESVFARKQDSPQGMDTFERTLAHDNRLVRGCMLGNRPWGCSLMQPALQQEERPSHCSTRAAQASFFDATCNRLERPPWGAEDSSSVPHAAHASAVHLTTNPATSALWASCLDEKCCLTFGIACCMPDMLKCLQEPAQWQTQSQGTYRTDFNADPAHYSPVLPQGKRAQLVGSACTAEQVLRSAACWRAAFPESSTKPSSGLKWDHQVTSIHGQPPNACLMQELEAMKAEAAAESAPPEEPTCWQSTSHDGTRWRGPSETRQAPGQANLVHYRRDWITHSQRQSSNQPIMQSTGCILLLVRRSSVATGMHAKWTARQALAHAEDLSHDDAVWDGG